MKLLYIGEFLFYKKGKETYALPSCSDSFFQKYLDVFESVKVLGAPMDVFLDTSALVEMKDERISVEIIAPNTRPKDFVNDRTVRLALDSEISKAEAILIKPANRRGMMAIKIAKKYNKPYMIEMTGDIHNALQRHPNFLKKMYAPFLYRQITKSIKDCKFGLYVSQRYLQKKYPIAGLMCGCSDVNIGNVSEEVLFQRLKKIETMNAEERVDIALIGFYQGLMKGVDTAIRALSGLPQTFHLHILGNGTEENRNKWFRYAVDHGIEKNRIHFPCTLPSSKDVMEWLDSMDFFVLPTLSEGLPRCLVEALSRGLICFGTNVCTLPELLDSECIHEVGDDRKLAEMIIRFSNDKGKMKKMAKRNFEKSKEFEFDVLKHRRNIFLKEFWLFAENLLH